MHSRVNHHQLLFCSCSFCLFIFCLFISLVASAWRQCSNIYSLQVKISLIDNWNILTLTEMELELEEKANSNIKILSAFLQPRDAALRTLKLDGGWKPFYSGADSSASAQSGVGILTSSQLQIRILLGSLVCILKPKVENQSICLLLTGICPQPQCCEWLSGLCGWSTWCFN